MLSFDEWILLGIVIGAGVFLRQHYVFFRKLLSGVYDRDDYEPIKLLESLGATIITTILAGLTNEFLALGFYDNTLRALLLAFLFGIFGQDIFHNVVKGARDSRI